VSHGFGGGIARHLDDLEALLRGHAQVLRLKPDRPGFVTLEWDGAALWFEAQREWQEMTGLLRAIGIDRVHFHHVDGLPQAVLGLPRDLGCPHDLTLHDYFPACANYHFADGAGRFCGGEPGCLRCSDAAPAPWGLTVAGWRSVFEPLLGTASRVITPSEDAAQRIRRFFPEASPVTWPHPESASMPRQRPVRVLVPGAISPAKGLEMIAGCIADAAQRALPLHFRILGFTARPLGSWPQAPVSLTGEYPEGALPALFALERGDVVFFPAQCAETFSYTLSDAIDTGLPIVATNLGALPERLAHYPLARIIPWEATPQAANEALLTCASPSTPGAIERPRAAPADYRERYLAGITRSSPSGGPLPALDPEWLSQRGEDTQRLWTVAGLFEDALLCGRASSAALLRGRAAEADRDAGHLHRARILLEQREAERARLDAEITEERARMASELATLRSEVAAAGHLAAQAREKNASSLAQLARMESSRSWRVTAPLRALLRLFHR
jgi:glycosyltransferase involved in cell wall biosynthesis